ncbi:hypothetical protein GCM10023322_84410 [Rugosimonospora acidiphila]|uniref:Uncharacterized protein n=1 Tax=Rugosimonospora acidiphila TaxID=556531 RepID=A0ABP9SVL0_9ACTN
MVGQGMADNPMNAVFIPAPTALAVSLIQVVGIPQSDSYYIETASGSFFGSTIPQMFANQMICTIIGAGAWVQSCWKCGTGGMKRCCGGL